MSSIDLSKLRAGVKVKLRGDVKPQPRKPYPRGWHEVMEVDYSTTEPKRIRIVSDTRWLPVSLIEEIVP